MADDYRNTYSDLAAPLGALTPGGAANGVFEAGSDKDVFAVTLTAGRTYSFSMVGAAVGGASDVYFNLLNSSGSYLTSASGYGGATAQKFYTATTTGTYYLSAEGAFSTTTGAYTVSVSAGYVDDYRDSYNDTLEALGAITPGASANGALEAGGDRDVFAVTLTAGRTYALSMVGAAVGGASDVYFNLLNSSGNYLTSASGYGGASAQTHYTATTTGTYYLSAEGAFSTTTGNYIASVSAGYVDDYRDSYNNTLEALGALTLGVSKNGVLEIGGDKDVFAVTLTAGVTYNLSMVGAAVGGASDVYFNLLDSSGNYVTSASGYGGASAQKLYTATTTGTYYLSAEGAFSSTTTGNYTVSVSSSFVDDYRDAYNDTLEALGAVAPGGSANGVLEAGGDKDVFAVTLTAGRTYNFSMIGAAVGGANDVYFNLLDSSGNYLTSASGYGGATAQKLYTAATTGTYYFSAEGAFASTTTGAYTIGVSAGYIDDYRDVHNSAVEALGAIAVGGGANGVLETGGDADIFAITLTAGQSYTFSMQGVAGGGLSDVSLSLLNASGGLINTQSGASGAAAQLQYTATTSGTHYLSAQGGALASIGAYTLAAATTTPPDDYRNSYNGAGALGALSVGGVATGLIGTAGDRDAFAVTLVAGQSYTFDLSSNGASPLGNPSLDLVNGAGAVLRKNNNFNSLNSRIVYTATASGTHYLYAHGASSTDTGGYQLSARLNFDDWRDTITDASGPLGALPVNSSRLGVIETGADRDVYAITLTAGQNYTFDLTRSSLAAAALGNPKLTLYSAAGAALLSNDNFNTVDSRLFFRATTTGTYYLEAAAATSGDTGGYLLSSRQNFDDSRDTITDTTADLGQIVAGGYMRGVIETGGDRDIFAITLTAGQSYTFDLSMNASITTALSNPKLALYDGAGALLRSNDNYNGRNSRVVYRATVTGTYYLEAGASTTSDVGGYQLNARENYDDWRDTIGDASLAFGALSPTGAAQLGAIETYGDSDTFVFALTAGQQYELDLKAASGAGALQNGDMQLLSSGGAVIGYDYYMTGVKNAGQIVFTADTTGNYYLNVRGAMIETGVYSVDLQQL